MNTLPPADDLAYLLRCVGDRVHLPETTPDQDRALLGQIEACFNVLLAPWINTCEMPRDRRNFLEIGCGDGKYGHFLARHVTRYLGVDIREEALARARALLKPLDNCEVMTGNGRDLAGVPDNSQHLVYSYQTFLCMPDREVVLSNLREVARVLADPGEARIQLLGPAYGSGLRLVWRKLGALSPDGGSAPRRAIIRALQRWFPGDTLLPSLRRRPYLSHWGQFGAHLHPRRAVALAHKLGCNAWISPSSYGSRYGGHDFGIYWLIMSRGRSAPPFFLTLD